MKQPVAIKLKQGKSVPCPSVKFAYELAKRRHDKTGEPYYVPRGTDHNDLLLIDGQVFELWPVTRFT